MTRILVHVEGQTEETFVNDVLAAHLRNLGLYPSARLLGNARQRSHRGGVRAWPSAMRDIVRHLSADPTAYATTMVDYYAMPADGERGWPGRANSALTSRDRADAVMAAMAESISQEMGRSFDPSRFVPFVVMHEFEGLLFSECERFAAGLARADLAHQFAHIRAGFDTPEDIDDSPVTAPSKRIERLMPNYQKVLHGNEAMLEIGIEAVRAACPIFDRWVAALEAIPVS